MIQINYSDSRPIYEKVKDSLRQLILSGALEADSRLPSVRELAMSLTINPNTIQRAYNELERAGFIYPVKGRGNFVSPDLKVIEEKKREFEGRLKKLAREGRELGYTGAELSQLLENADKGQANEQETEGSEASGKETT